ncbi:MAG: WecB/TagA/CpsF family glycosyltransferase [bacterium]
MKIKILNIPIDNLSHQELKRSISESKIKKCQMIVTVNPEIIMETRASESYRKIIQNADLCIPDGTGIILAARYLGTPLKKRITGLDLIDILIELSMENNQSLFLLGGEPGVAEQAVLRLLEKHPKLRISGFDSGFRFWGMRLPDIIIRNKINKTGAAVLLVAMGAPKQELWIAKNKKYLKSVKYAVGVGGLFDYISGNVRRAPKVIQKVGLEWLWRLLKQPWRWKRILTAVWDFPVAVIRYKIT